MKNHFFFLKKKTIVEAAISTFDMKHCWVWVDHETHAPLAGFHHRGREKARELELRLRKKYFGFFLSHHKLEREGRVVRGRIKRGIDEGFF